MSNQGASLERTRVLGSHSAKCTFPTGARWRGGPTTRLSPLVHFTRSDRYGGTEWTDSNRHYANHKSYCNVDGMQHPISGFPDVTNTNRRPSSESGSGKGCPMRKIRILSGVQQNAREFSILGVQNDASGRWIEVAEPVEDESITMGQYSFELSQDAEMLTDSTAGTGVFTENQHNPWIQASFPQPVTASSVAVGANWDRYGYLYQYPTEGSHYKYELYHDETVRDDTMILQYSDDNVEWKTLATRINRLSIADVADNAIGLRKLLRGGL